MANRFCTQCGKPVGENDNFCAFCATPVQRVQAEPATEQQLPQEEPIQVPENSAEIPPQYTMPQQQAQPASQPQGNLCPVCGKPVYPQAVICVHCGAQMPQKQVGNPQQPLMEQKSRLTAGLLGILLGCFGAHNFYLGYTNRAIAQLLITILGGCLVIPAAAAAVWGLIEGIMLLTGSINVDAKGVPLKE